MFKIINKFLPNSLIDFLIEIYNWWFLKREKISIKKTEKTIDIFGDSEKCLRISRKHNVYLQDIVKNFDYYFSAVEPIKLRGLSLVDYSRPRLHKVKGYNLHSVKFPSLAEPCITTQQYVKFANLKNGSVVLDLGAYSGLTSIIFDQLIGQKGKVIAVDADKLNIKCIKENFKLYKKFTNRDIALVEGAVWKHNKGLMFATEGNTGSSATDYIGKFRGKSVKVKSYTLGHIAKMYKLARLDFIKCDIEGAEAEIFKDADFFEKYKPKIIIETHLINNKNTISLCIKQLKKYGYKCKEIKQLGVALPLLECV